MSATALFKTYYLQQHQKENTGLDGLPGWSYLLSISFTIRRISYYPSVILLYNFIPIRVTNCKDNYFVNNCVLGMGIRCTIFCGTNVSMSELKY